MYKKLVPLNSKEHGKHCLLPVNDYRCASSQLVAPIVIDEVADVAREYPIVFPVGSRLPVALLGIEKDSNAYIGNHGQWLASYIPAHLRHYPLKLASIKDAATANSGKAQSESEKSKNGVAKAKSSDEARFVVLLDIESPFVSQHQGEPMFDALGKLTRLTEQKKALMEQVQRRAVITQRLVQAIEEAGLLKERSIRIKRPGQADRQVGGVRAIDESVLNKMNDAAFNKLRNSGALPLVYAALLSWANFRQGPIGKSHPIKPAAGLNADDIIRFN
jgi:hypothetical protein